MIFIQRIYVGARLLNFDTTVNEILVIPEAFYTLSKKNALPGFLKDQSIILELGNIAVNGIERCNFLYREHSYLQIKEQGYPIDSKISDAHLGIKLVNQFNGEMNRYLIALWFVKDNSVSSAESYYINGVSKTVLYNSIGEFSTNASGNVNETSFSERELDEVEDWFDLITTHTLFKEIENVDFNDIMTVDQEDSREKVNLSSFSRSLLYLNSARKNGFIPAKIASYISVLETLFAVKGDNTRKVSERLSKFIGNTEVETNIIYEKIKKLYDIRSSYVHGSDVKNTLEQQLLEYSILLDSYVRRAMKKILIEHNELNYGQGTGKKFKETNHWFENL